MTALNFIDYPCSAGTDTVGSEKAPSYYINSQYFNQLKTNIDLNIPSKLSNQPNGSTKKEKVRNACKKLNNRVCRSLNKNNIPLVLGGDHTSAMGTWPAIANQVEDLNLLYIDAHLDAHTPTTSHTKNIHGMILSQLTTDENWLGYETKKNRPLDPANVYLFGARSYEQEERKFINNQGIKVFPDRYIKQRSTKKALNDVFKLLDGKPLGVSIDLDAFPPRTVPGVNVRVKNGGIDSNALFSELKNKNNIAGIEISEYNPKRDRNDKTAKFITKNISALFSD